MAYNWIGCYNLVWCGIEDMLVYLCNVYVPICAGSSLHRVGHVQQKGNAITPAFMRPDQTEPYSCCIQTNANALLYADMFMHAHYVY